MTMVAIEFKFPAWEKKLKAAREQINRFVAAQMQFNRGMLFDQEGAYNGHPGWAPLKFRVGQILKDTGTLSKSIGPKNGNGTAGPGGYVNFNQDTITIGTSLGYARLMNDGTSKMPGGKLTAVNAKALAIPLPSGKKASDLAKNLRKESSGKKELEHKIAGLQIRLQHSKDPKTKAALREKLARYKAALERGPKNQRVIFRKSVRIPARPFDTWNDQDQSELEVALANKIAEILNR